MLPMLGEAQELETPGWVDLSGSKSNDRSLRRVNIESAHTF
jgi:hypothetical protein